jgi:hypothetical protein
LSMGKERDMEHSNGIMEKNFKEIGRMEWKVVSVSGDHQKVITMKDSGRTIDSKAKVYLSIEIAHTKAHLKVF